VDSGLALDWTTHHIMHSRLATTIDETKS
jgi:hypothetical protein